MCRSNTLFRPLNQIGWTSPFFLSFSECLILQRIQCEKSTHWMEVEKKTLSSKFNGECFFLIRFYFFRLESVDQCAVSVSVCVSSLDLIYTHFVVIFFLLFCSYLATQKTIYCIQCMYLCIECLLYTSSAQTYSSSSFRYFIYKMRSSEKW